MELIEQNELLKISGGGFSFGAIAAIASGIAFIISVIDGYIRPLNCR